MECNYYIEYPNSLKGTEYKFKINSDDLGRKTANRLAKFLRDEGFEVKRSRYHSPTKLMSWSNYTLSKEGIIFTTFDENKNMVESLINKFDNEMC